MRGLGSSFNKCFFFLFLLLPHIKKKMWGNVEDCTGRLTLSPFTPKLPPYFPSSEYTHTFFTSFHSLLPPLLRCVCTRGTFILHVLFFFYFFLSKTFKDQLYCVADGSVFTVRSFFFCVLKLKGLGPYLFFLYFSFCIIQNGNVLDAQITTICLFTDTHQTGRYRTERTKHTYQIFVFALLFVCFIFWGKKDMNCGSERCKHSQPQAKSIASQKFCLVNKPFLGNSLRIIAQHYCFFFPFFFFPSFCKIVLFCFVWFFSLLFTPSHMRQGDSAFESLIHLANISLYVFSFPYNICIRNRYYRLHTPPISYHPFFLMFFFVNSGRLGLTVRPDARESHLPCFFHALPLDTLLHKSSAAFQGG